MKIFSSLEELKGKYQGCVTVLGNFDGLHLGHQVVINSALQRARQKKTKLVVITFRNHPLSVICPEMEPDCIDDAASRHYGMEKLGWMCFWSCPLRLSLPNSRRRIFCSH